MDRKELKERLKKMIDIQADALFDHYEDPKREDNRKLSNMAFSFFIATGTKAAFLCQEEDGFKVDKDAKKQKVTKAEEKAEEEAPKPKKKRGRPKKNPEA